MVMCQHLQSAEGFIERKGVSIYFKHTVSDTENDVKEPTVDATIKTGPEDLPPNNPLADAL